MQLFHRVVQLSRKLDARRPPTNNRDINLPVRTHIAGVLQEQVQHFLVETTCLMWVIEEDTVLFYTWCVEVIGGTAQRHDQRVIRQFALRDQQFPFFIAQLCQGNGFALTIDIHHGAQLELEMVIARMCQIAQRVHALIQ